MHVMKLENTRPVGRGLAAKGDWVKVLPGQPQAAVPESGLGKCPGLLITIWGLS